MGIDAALFAFENKDQIFQMFYYDREYNLEPPIEYEGFLWEIRGKLSEENGLSKQELEDYLEKLIGIFERRREEVGYNRVVWAKKVLEWTKSLPEECKIISRNDARNEYFELYKKYDERDKEKKQL